MLPLHPGIVALISSFLFNRTQSTRLNNIISKPLRITRSVIQGSGFGPMLYAINAHDLKTVSVTNKLCLYADDNNILVPEKSDVGPAEELNNVKKWANANKLVINLSKTKLLIFRRPNLNSTSLPAGFPGIETVDCIKLLGVFVSSVFNQSAHVNFLTCTANQRLYLLKILRQNGLNVNNLDCIFTAIVVSRITYAIESWGNFVSREQEEKINKMFRKAKRWGLCTKLYTFQELKELRHDKFFKNICKNSSHCLYHLMPPLRDTLHSLRSRMHNHQLIRADKNLYQNSFIVSSLLTETKLLINCKRLHS